MDVDEETEDDQMRLADGCLSDATRIANQTWETIKRVAYNDNLHTQNWYQMLSQEEKFLLD